jgi:hypothetical protein
MKISFFLVGALVIGFLSCKKDQYKSVPQISIESINTVIPVGGELDAKFQFTQKNGNLSNGTFIAIRNRLNQQQLPPGTGSADTLTGPIPSFPNKNEGEFDFSLPYSYLNESQTQNDTIEFKFAVVDAGGNKSDTITSPIIVILYQ